jgi:LysR family transcriptional regulator, glycine cleavage system transcriptional activator
MPLRPHALSTLGVFAVAARHQNFAHAAEELHLTASAVSHHVRQLEKTLGVTLFQRHARGVLLTPGGRALADAASSALADIEAAASALRTPLSGTTTLTVATLHSFTHCWLVPRLERFLTEHPDVRLKLETGITLARFDSSGPDLAIRYGAGHWPGLTAYHLMDEDLFPVVAPSMPGLAQVTEARHILELPLVSDMGLQGWPDWFRAAGLHGVSVPQTHIFTDSTDALVAAAHGLGATLTRSRIAPPYLLSGQVVRLPGPTLKARFSYYVVHPSHRPPSGALAALIDWLREEAALDEDS